MLIEDKEVAKKEQDGSLLTQNDVNDMENGLNDTPPVRYFSFVIYKIFIPTVFLMSERLFGLLSINRTIQL